MEPWGWGGGFGVEVVAWCLIISSVLCRFIIVVKGSFYIVFKGF